jgi:formylglycine-generating enzyme required for sulfatase activity
MSGNVWEYCWDWFKDKPDTAQTNPLGPISGTHRVARGGAWSHDAVCAGIARRTYDNPDDPSYKKGIHGFRVVRRNPTTTLSVPQMIEVSGGTFNNGKSDVTLSNYNISKTEITQGMYEGLIGYNPSSFTESALRPVEKVSFYDA